MRQVPTQGMHVHLHVHVQQEVRRYDSCVRTGPEIILKGFINDMGMWITIWMIGLRTKA